LSSTQELVEAYVLKIRETAKKMRRDTAVSREDEM